MDNEFEDDNYSILDGMEDPDKPVLDNIPIILEPQRVPDGYQDLQQNELQHINLAMEGIKAAWKIAFSVKDVCALALTSTKVLQVRRDLLAPGNLKVVDEIPEETKSKYLSPYDN